MKENIWIYMSCLAFCAAIGHRVWEYEKEQEKYFNFGKVTRDFEDALRNRFYLNKETIKESSRRDRRYVRYAEEMAIVDYLVKNDDLEELQKYYLKDSIEEVYLVQINNVSERLQKYMYANFYLEHFGSLINVPNRLDEIEIVGTAIKTNDSRNHNYSVGYEIFSSGLRDIEIEYHINSEKMPTLDSGILTTEIPSNIEILLTDNITGENKSYIFQNGKLH